MGGNNLIFNQGSSDNGDVSSAFLKEAQQDFDGWFKNSVVRDADGRPLIVFHASPAEFKIENIDALSHFGSSQAAQEAGSRRCANGYITYPVFLNIRNPIRIPDTGGHSADFYKLIFEQILPEWSGETVMDKDEIDYVFGLDTWRDYVPFSRFMFPEHSTQKEKWAERMIEVLSAKGYDGFIYDNSVEDTGSYSFIIFNSNQVRSALLQGVGAAPLYLAKGQGAEKFATPAVVVPRRD